MRRVRLRELTAEERATLERLAHSRTAQARLVERARMIWYASQGDDAPLIAQRMQVRAFTVREWIKRFNAGGLPGLEDRPRSGRPATYTAEGAAEEVQRLAERVARPHLVSLGPEEREQGVAPVEPFRRRDRKVDEQSDPLRLHKADSSTPPSAARRSRAPRARSSNIW